MSEYWKSTPKYWCKFCSTYVRDTPLEKRNHESTGRHLGQIQRSLRTMHKEHERDERDKQRAKDEVARVNGVVSGVRAPRSAGTLVNGHVQSSSSAPTKAASAEDRKKQLKQLADMGVAIPEEYRAEMALAGDWKTTAVRRLDMEEVMKEEDVKPEMQSFGVRKRKHEGAEEEEEAGAVVARKGWGSTLKTYPGRLRGEEDIASLFEKPAAEAPILPITQEVPQIKIEDSKDNAEVDTLPIASGDAMTIKQETEQSLATPVVFKKRKARVAKDG